MSCLNARDWAKGMSGREIEQRFAEMEAQIEEFREMVNNAEFWIQKLELNPELVALRRSVKEQDQKNEDLKKIVDNAAFWIQRLELNPEIVALHNAVQEKDQEIAELKETIGIRSAFIRSLSNRMDKNEETIKDLQDFKSKFLDFKSQCSCSQFRDFWPWG